MGAYHVSGIKPSPSAPFVVWLSSFPSAVDRHMLALSLQSFIVNPPSYDFDHRLQLYNLLPSPYPVCTTCRIHAAFNWRLMSIRPILIPYQVHDGQALAAA